MIKGVNFKLSATNAGGAAMKGFQNGLAAVENQTRSLNRANSSMMRGMSQNRRAFQQIGFQVTDFSVQMAGGQSAMLAFIQQGGQVLQFFGTTGAVLAGLLSVFGTLIYIFIKSGQSLVVFKDALGVLPFELEIIRTALVAVKEALLDFVNLIINNFDRIVIIASVVAGFFIGRWVIAMLAATVSVGGLNAALIFLRANLLRTGIGVLLVALGEAVYQFLRLMDAVGGFANALGLLKDVAVEVFDRIVISMGLLPAAMSVAANGMAAWFIGKIHDMLYNFVEFTWAIADGLNGLFGTSLTGASGQMTVELNEIRWGYEDAAAAATNAYNGAMSDVRKPLASIKAIRDALAGVKDTDIDVRDLAGKGVKGGAAGGAGGGAADKVKTEAEKIKKIFDDLSSSISETMQSGFKAVLKGTMSVTDYLSSVLDKIADQVFDILMTPIFNKLAGGIAGGLMGAMGFPGFAGGGYTGSGSRSGGIDGQGGFMALLHPQETVIDHARGQSMGGGSGGTVTIMIQEGASFASTVQAISSDTAVRVVRAGIQEYDTKQLPNSVKRVQQSPRSR